MEQSLWGQLLVRRSVQSDEENLGASWGITQEDSCKRILIYPSLRASPMQQFYIEKILRVQPNVKKLYLLLRAADTKSALNRFNNEVISKDLFGVLKEKRGANLSAFILEKVTIVPGDITRDNLRIDDLKLSLEISTEVDVVINLAATTNFDERNIDSFVLGYGKGKMKCFPGDPQSIVDLIPADMVVNAMIAAMVAHADQPGTHIIYHVGSSMANPVSYNSLQDYGLRYFTKNPWSGKDGKPVIVVKGKQLSSVAMFQRYMDIHYLIPLKILFCADMNAGNERFVETGDELENEDFNSQGKDDNVQNAGSSLGNHTWLPRCLGNQNVVAEMSQQPQLVAETAQKSLLGNPFVGCRAIKYGLPRFNFRNPYLVTKL
ncbi:Fatty acyl-CoA reductase [Forsythia ovata]|uniref:Fatty acyl-CoA reductase n=1 Tax=Forsythia ovata TaxID=205694 RepID=A0ABD1XA13_9LAMI